MLIIIKVGNRYINLTQVHWMEDDDERKMLMLFFAGNDSVELRGEERESFLKQMTKRQ